MKYQLLGKAYANVTEEPKVVKDRGNMDTIYLRLMAGWDSFGATNRVTASLKGHQCSKVLGKLHLDDNVLIDGVILPPNSNNTRQDRNMADITYLAIIDHTGIPVTILLDNTEKNK